MSPSSIDINQEELLLEDEFTDSEIEDEGIIEVESGSAGIVIEKNDRSLSEFSRWHQRGRLVVDPEWQRQYVWSPKQASRLIESFLIDIPVPVIYLARSDEGKYEVIDGLQRLTSVFKFFNGEMSLSSLPILRDFNGKKFSELPEHFQVKLEDATLRTFELASRTSKDLVFTIFERLNTGGTKLNQMEIRNCLYRGSLNNLIKELVEYPEFVQVLNQKSLQNRMADRAFALSFIAFYEKTHLKVKRSLAGFLNDFLDEYQYANQTKLDEWKQQFKKSMRACYTIFGEWGFRLRRTDRESSRGKGEWSPRPNRAVFQAISVAFCNYDLPELTRASDAILEEYLDLISTDKEWESCVTTTTAEPSRIRYVFDTWKTRLETVMANYPSNDRERIFSRALKEELFQQNNACAICNQRIVLINDAAIDHIEHYWRGGETIPENARLVHRACNLSRSHSH